VEFVEILYSIYFIIKKAASRRFLDAAFSVYWIYG
jgi:hypothetical protein